MNQHFSDKKIATKAIHAGEEPDPASGASAPHIAMSTTFVVNADTGFSVEGMDEDAAWVYTRWGNPTIAQLEAKLAILENGESAIAFSSGMAAVSALFLHLLRQGDHAIVSDVAYAALSELTNEIIPHWGIAISKVDTSDTQAVANAVRPNTRLIYVETPCNPILRLTDITQTAEIANRAGAKLAVDSTFATPIATRPLELGADYVVHSLTKYMCGHGDALGGAIVGKKSDLAVLRKNTAIRLGGTISPFNAWLIMRGIATLPIRMKSHAGNALAVALFLESHPKIERVFYPGLSSHPQHDLAKKQMQNFSGMVTFRMKNGSKAAKLFARHLHIIHYAVSLGHHRSLIFYLRSDDLLQTSFKFDTDAQRQSWEMFAGHGIFRLSVGLEDADDIIADLANVLEMC
ncbi:MAG: PLP-dependent aspartate aminotransferase family protein [Breznakibacter sp.]